MRGTFSAFLKSLSALFSTPANGSIAPVRRATPAETLAKLPSPVRPHPQNNPGVAKSRSPVLPPEDVAAYWKGGLDYVNFSSFVGKSNDEPAHKTILSLDEVTQAATQIEEGVVGEDVVVVLLLCQLNKRDQRLVNRHPLLAVPALFVEEKFLAPRTTAAPILNPTYLSPDQKGNAFAIADSQLANERMYDALGQLAADKSLQVDCRASRGR